MTKGDDKVVVGGEISFEGSNAKADDLVVESTGQQNAQPEVVYDDLSEIIAAYIIQIGTAFNIPPNARSLFAYGYHVVPSNLLYDSLFMKGKGRSYFVRPITNTDNEEDAEEILKHACPGLKYNEVIEYHMGRYHVDFNIFPEYAAIEEHLRGERYERYPFCFSFDILRVPPTARTFFLGVLHNNRVVDEFNADVSLNCQFNVYGSKLNHRINLNDVLTYAKKIKLKESDAIKYAKMLPR